MWWYHDDDDRSGGADPFRSNDTKNNDTKRRRISMVLLGVVRTKVWMLDVGCWCGVVFWMANSFNSFIRTTTTTTVARNTNTGTCRRSNSIVFCPSAPNDRRRLDDIKYCRSVLNTICIYWFEHGPLNQDSYPIRCFIFWTKLCPKKHSNHYYQHQSYIIPISIVPGTVNLEIIHTW